MFPKRTRYKAYFFSWYTSFNSHMKIGNKFDSQLLIRKHTARYCSNYLVSINISSKLCCNVGDVTQWQDHLPGRHEALGSNPNTKERKKRG